MIAEYLGLVILLGAAVALLGGLFAVQRAAVIRSAARVPSTDRDGATPPAFASAEPADPPAEHASRRGRPAAKFYLVALLFGGLNVASLFFFAWGAAFRDLGWDGLLTAGIFALPLVVAVVYQWRNGVFEW